MTRRLLLSYLSLAVLVLACLEVPLGFLYSRGERERVVNSAKDEAESVSAYAALSLSAGRAERDLPDRVAHWRVIACVPGTNAQTYGGVFITFERG